MTKATGETKASSMPKEVRIGSLTYAVAQRDNLTLDGQPQAALIHYMKGLIEINGGDTAPEYRRFLLWHEIVHGLLRQAGYPAWKVSASGKLRDGHNEKLIDVIAFGIMRVLQDNPALREISDGD